MTRPRRCCVGRSRCSASEAIGWPRRAIVALGRALFGPFRTEQALAVLEPAAEEFADLGTDTIYVALLGQLARAYMMNGDSERSIEVSDRVLEMAERADLVAIVADTLVTKGTALGSLGRGYEGLGSLETGMHLAERHGLAVTAVGRASTAAGCWSRAIRARLSRTTGSASPRRGAWASARGPTCS